MTRSSVLLLVALTAFALPAGAQPAANPGTQPGATAPATPVVTVKTKNGLIAAINEANTRFTDTIREVTIKIDTCEAQQLPPGIQAKGKITIVGCGDVPAGAGGQDDVPRTVLTPTDQYEGTVFYSPVKFRGVHVKKFTNHLFQTFAGITLANSVFEAETFFGFGTAKAQNKD